MIAAARSPWLPEHDALLREGYAAGRTDAEMAEALTRSAASIRRRRQVLGLVQAVPHIDRERLRMLRAEGLTAREIAAELGTTTRYVQTLAHALHLPGRGRGRPRLTEASGSTATRD